MADSNSKVSSWILGITLLLALTIGGIYGFYYIIERTHVFSAKSRVDTEKLNITVDTVDCSGGGKEKRFMLYSDKGPVQGYTYTRCSKVIKLFSSLDLKVEVSLKRNLFDFISGSKGVPILITASHNDTVIYADGLFGKIAMWFD